MIVYPAIDIRGGKCVRLVEGDFNRETVFGANPSETACEFEHQGTEWIHVVDLDGAKNGTPANTEAILAIREAISIPMQVGGGLRSIADVLTYLEAGIDRVVLGTVAYRNPAMIEKLASAHADSIAVGIDARDGRVAGDGWLDQTSVDAIDLTRRLMQTGISTVVYTDIKRDGTLTGPNLEELEAMQRTMRTGLIASGGISTLADIEAVFRTGVDGVIIGRALYDGRFTLREAMATSRRLAEVA